MIEGAEVVITGNVTFVITGSKIIVCTRLQAFILQPRDYCWNKRLQTIKFLIQIGRIKDLNSLAESCQGHMQWVPTKIPMMS